MKRLMGFVFACLLAIGTAGSAVAATGDLFLVAYGEADGVNPPNARTDAEVAFSFGQASSFNFGDDCFNVDTGITLNDFAVSDWSDVYVGVFGGGYTSGYDLADAYFGSSVAVQAGDLGGDGGFSSFRSASLYMGMAGYDGGLEADQGYVSYMDADGNNPKYAGLVPLGGFLPEARLADGSVSMGMYTTPDGLTLTNLTEWTLDTSSGNLVVSQSQVPLPGSLILLGSGVLGFFGIRRKRQ